MKARIFTIGAVLLALTSFALADGNKHQKAHNHHIVLKRVSMSRKKTKTYFMRHRGGSKTVTYTLQHRPKPLYSKAEWERRIREARERRRHRHGSTWYKSVKSQKHTTWVKAVTRRKKHTTWVKSVTRRHRGGHTFVWSRHDNGKHLGWTKGKGNPHRTGDWNGKGHRDGDHDRDDHKGHHDKDDHKGHHDKDDHKGHGKGH